jgi:putative membrane protein
MLWFKRALGLLLVVILTLGTLVFVLENQQKLTLSYLGFSTPTLPVALYVVAAFVAGGVIGLLLGQLMVSRLKYRLKAAETQLARKSQEAA